MGIKIKFDFARAVATSLLQLVKNPCSIFKDFDGKQPSHKGLDYK